MQTFNVRPEDSHILNFNLGHKIVESNKNPIPLYMIEDSCPFPLSAENFSKWKGVWDCYLTQNCIGSNLELVGLFPSKSLLSSA